MGYANAVWKNLPTRALRSKENAVPVECWDDCGGTLNSDLCRFKVQDSCLTDENSYPRKSFNCAVGGLGTAVGTVKHTDQAKVHPLANSHRHNWNSAKSDSLVMETVVDPTTRACTKRFRAAPNVQIYQDTPYIL
uniref:Nucleolar protein 11 n=1 Tax=Lygus hesperus TaxID=30085 RepID=A0A0A9Y2N1_LYGHE